MLIRSQNLRSLLAGERFLRPAILALVFCSMLFPARAAEVIPPRPPRYFNDEARVVSPGTAQQLNQKLESFERETSDQVIVVVYPKMQTDSSIEDYTQRVAQKWQVGQKDKNNGIVLFVFVEDRKMFIQVGYGLEGALPDALAKRIVEEEIKPFFKAGDFNGGMTAGVNAILAAVKGEYKGTGRTVADRNTGGSSLSKIVFFAFFFFILLSFLRGFGRRGRVYSRRGRGFYGGAPIFWGSGGGGGWSGGSSGGGGFSSGGGSFGGGGAGGSW